MTIAERQTKQNWCSASVAALTPRSPPLSLWRPVGARNVIGVALPSRFSSNHSITDAEKLAANLSIELRKIPIDPVHKAFESALQFSDLAGENLQARIRAVVANGHFQYRQRPSFIDRSISLRSQSGTQQCMVTALAASLPSRTFSRPMSGKFHSWLNARGDTEVIPENSITKEPSAELRPDQIDTDSLPDYQTLRSSISSPNRALGQRLTK